MVERIVPQLLTISMAIRNNPIQRIAVAERFMPFADWQQV